MKQRIDKERFVTISGMERTIIDGFRHSAFSGCLAKVAKGLRMKRNLLKAELIVDHARRLVPPAGTA